MAKLCQAAAAVQTVKLGKLVLGNEQHTCALFHSRIELRSVQLHLDFHIFENYNKTCFYFLIF